MPIIVHEATPEVIAEVKEAFNAPRRERGLPEQDIYKKSFPTPSGKIDFLYTYLTDGQYQHLLKNTTLKDVAKKSPEEAEFFFNSKMLEACVLWPGGNLFNPHQRAELQPYPAGVMPGLIEAINTVTGFTLSPMPDVLAASVDTPVLPSEEQLEILRANAPYGLFKKEFYLGSWNGARRDYDPVLGRVYYFVPCSYATYSNGSRAENDADMAMAIVPSCVLWPREINWEEEPIGNILALKEAVLSQSGFAGDPLDDLQPV